MIQAIIFDCFGVLYVDPTAYFYNIAVRHHDDAQAEHFAQLLRQTDAGLLTHKQFCKEVADAFGFSPQQVEDKLLKGVDRNTELISYVRTLRPRFKVGLLSNISRGVMQGFFSEAERTELFDSVVLSGDAGLVKPDPAIFTLAAERLDVEPHNVIFIDDNERNCAGARQAGLTAIHFTNNKHLEEEITVLTQ